MLKTPARLAAVIVLSVAALLRADTADSKKTEGDEKLSPFGVAHIEIKGSYPDAPQPPGIFGEVSEGLSAAIARLDRAAGDDNIAAVVLHIDGPHLGWAKLNDLRQAIGRIRAKNKKVTGFLDEGTSI